MKKQVVIYLHGFNSSPNSVKAQQTVAFFAKYYPDIQLLVPQLALSPHAAWQQIDQLAMQHQQDQLGFIGSSMGGFFATLLANKYDGRGVLINPAVKPHLLIEGLVGDYQNPYSGEQHSVTLAHGRELESLQFHHINYVDRLWILLQQADETLDYSLAVEAYSGARITLEPLGDHGFVGFNRYLNSIVGFLFKNSL